jgi:hypothetical protein
MNRTAGWNKYYGKTYYLRMSNVTGGYNYEIWGGDVYSQSIQSASGINRTPFFLVGIASSTDTTFIDSVRYDSVSTGPWYNYSQPASMLENVFSYGGRMWGTRGSNIYWSGVDTSSKWGAFQFVNVGSDDGDVITAAWPTRRAIRVFKNKSSYNVYQDANLNWNLSEVSSNIGCIASKSHIAGARGHYYLSTEGFVRESDGQYLERTSNAEIISSKLDNFDKLPMTTLSGAYGAYIDGKCLWTIGDTTYVYDEKADAWSTWGFKIGGSTMYSAGSNVAFMPGDSLYFYSPDKKGIFVYGLDGYDTAGVSGSIVLKWKSAPLLLSSEQKILNTVGTWTSGNGKGLSGGIYDERDSSLVNLGNFLFSDSTDNRYYKSSVKLARPSMFYQLMIQHTMTSPFSLNAFDLFYYNAGERETK